MSAKTGHCWPKNETLAKALNVDVRTIQRGIADLRNSNWLVSIRIPGIRRALKINFPNEVGSQLHCDKPIASNMTKQTRKHDKSVAPYKNKVINKGNQFANSRALPCVPVDENETGVVDAWIEWIDTNTGFDGKSVLSLLKHNHQYMLPSRFVHEERCSDYEKFFEFMGATRKSSSY